MNIKELETEYKELQNSMSDLSKQIIEHLKTRFDEKLSDYNSWDDFLEDVNNYAGDTFGKLIYINHAKNLFEALAKK